MKTTIKTNHAPKAVGPYSQGVVSENLIFTSGQIALDPVSGMLVPGGIEEQTRQVMQNLKAVLDAAGTGFEKVLKTTVYLKDINDFSVFNNIYAQFFPGEPPARSTVQVAALPLDARIEIEIIACR